VMIGKMGSRGRQLQWFSMLAMIAVHPTRSSASDVVWYCITRNANVKST